MECIKIGILTCSNTTQVLDCPAGGCLADLYGRKGEFTAYEGYDVELAGIISCNNCPTLEGEAVILPKIEGLLHYGAQNIHIAYCMGAVCPFIKKYIKVIKMTYPEINLISGTHEPHQTDREFRCATAKMLIDRNKTIIP